MFYSKKNVNNLQFINKLIREVSNKNISLFLLICPRNNIEGVHKGILFVPPSIAIDFGTRIATNPDIRAFINNQLGSLIFNINAVKSESNY